MLNHLIHNTLQWVGSYESLRNKSGHLHNSSTGLKPLHCSSWQQRWWQWPRRLFYLHEIRHRASFAARSQQHEWDLGWEAPPVETEGSAPPALNALGFYVSSDIERLRGRIRRQEWRKWTRMVGTASGYPPLTAQIIDKVVSDERCHSAVWPPRPPWAVSHLGPVCDCYCPFFKMQNKLLDISDVFVKIKCNNFEEVLTKWRWKNNSNHSPQDINMMHLSNPKQVSVAVNPQFSPSIPQWLHSRTTEAVLLLLLHVT